MPACMDEQRPSLDELRARAGWGLTCPQCGGSHFWTTRTREGPNLIRRTRVCRKCGQRGTTRETAERWD